jgi:hypothetical protein
VVSYFLRYFSSTSTEQISPDSAGPFKVSIRLALLFLLLNHYRPHSFSTYVAVYRSLLKRPSISERETTVPMPRPVLEKRLNGQGLNGGRAHRAAETDALF